MIFLKKTAWLLLALLFFTAHKTQTAQTPTAVTQNIRSSEEPDIFEALSTLNIPEKNRQIFYELLENNTLNRTELWNLIKNYPWDLQKASTPKDWSLSDGLTKHASLFSDSYEKIRKILELNASLPKKNHKILILTSNLEPEKERAAQSIADAMGRPHYTVNCNPKDLDGTFSTGFAGTLSPTEQQTPGAIIQALASTGVCNPVIILKNIHKLPEEEFPLLIKALEAKQEKPFRDNVLQLDINTSEITFILLVNHVKSMPKKIAAKLADRAEYINLGRYTRDQKIEIIYKYILPDLLKNYLLSNETLASILQYIPAIIDRSTTNNSGLAQTIQTLSTILTHCAIQSLENQSTFVITPQDIENLIPKATERPILNIPSYALQILQQKLSEGPSSGPYIRMCETFPWKKEQPQKLNATSAVEALNADLFLLSAQKQRIFGILKSLANTPNIHRKGICIVGAQGTGKTTLAKAGAQALGQPKYLANIENTKPINGDSFFPEPGLFLSAFCSTKTQRPTIILENIDKTPSPQIPILVSALNPTTNSHFMDQFAGFEIDLSGMFIIATATDASLIPEKILDHLELIYLDGYTPNEKLFIAQNYLLKNATSNRQMQNHEIEEIKNILPILIEQIAPISKGLNELNRVISSLVAQQIESLECFGRTLQLSAKNVLNFVDPLLTTHQIRESENIQAKCNEVIKKLNLTLDQFKHIDSHITALKPWRGGNALTLLYMDWIARFPFNTTTQNIPSLKDALSQLNSTHFGLGNIKESIIDFLAGMHFSSKETGTKNTKSLCFVGGPGIGKTTFSESIAKALARPFTRIALESVQSLKGGMGEHEMFGDGPGPIGRALCDTKSLNPVILLDEIDKANPKVVCQLLELLDPAQNKTFRDSFLGFDLDLSNVIFIASANDSSRIPDPLADRLHTISMEPYSQQERIDIANNMIIPKIVSDMGFSPEIAENLHELVGPMVKIVTKTEYGVRNLKRFLQSAADKYARLLIEEKPITSLTASDILGSLHPELLQTNPASQPATEAVIGITNGMYAHGRDGGGIMKIEASVIPYGKGKLIKTLLHGDMSLESHSRTLAHVKSLCSKYNINPEIFSTSDFLFSDQTYHKVDGPSAGVAQAVALISALTKRAVKPGYAMTGAIDAYGHLLPVGGYRAKILGTERSGIKNILLPECSKNTIEQIRKDFPEINIIYIKTLDEAVQILLEA